ncbi:MAG: tRNA (adenosine(37)-N6)-threonylcarbamoyltransferase complex ATPase subunit type 1 TsaE [Ruminococcaceae bacterium]|nr:tRNA (adenosine(37)-N6)-threonylcarbamoyltransferase complex ATPase subunit type 1 TsaE [Oscillospiraceae bacterium]
MDQIKTVYTASPEETEECGAVLARLLVTEPSLPRFVALYGDLGVGKTAFVRGFTSVISPNAPVRSPTFAIVNEYRASPLSVFHFDMYRIDSEDDLLSIGYDDYLVRPGICLTEWSEKIEDALPEERINVRIEKNDPTHPMSRSITITHVSEENA